MRDRRLPSPLFALLLLTAACGPAGQGPGSGTPAPPPPPAEPGEGRDAADLLLPQERRLSNLRMLTDGGENAEAYWSWAGDRFVYQARRGERTCDAIRVMNVDGSAPTTIHPGGANTCAYFLEGDERVIFASTVSGGEDCPPRPDRSQGYVWPIYADYELYTARPDGSDLKRLTNSPGYDAEATVGPDGTIVFTSTRDGDLDLYLMDPDGSNVRRLTDTPGYDGGAFFSPDGTKIVYRASRPETPEELEDYRALLDNGLVRPNRLELYVMNADGSNQRKVTNLGKAAFCPFFTPDSKAIIFTSNHLDPRGRNFDLFLVTLDGTKLERVTWNPSFDGFPMFSPDGTKLVFGSNRGNSSEGDTNVFVADWNPLPALN